MYQYINQIEPKNLFKYIIIIFLFFIIFTTVKITKGSLLGLFFGFLLVYYLNSKYRFTKITKKEEDLIKLNNIYPPPENFGKYPDLVDFFFSIQDFYKYNPQAYEEMIFNVESMITIYEDVKKGIRFCKDNYDVAEQKKRNAINSLHSIIYSIEDNQVVTRKLNRAMRILNNILSNYTYKILEKCKGEIEKDGYDNEKHFIELDYHPRPFNEFVKEDFTFDIY